MRRFLAVSAVVLALCVVGVASPGSASPIAVQIDYTDTGITGTAVATFDDILLGLSSVSDLSKLDGFSMSIYGLSPSPTTFAKSDLTGWLLSAGGGTITDINFFMDGGGTNADGYSIQGVEVFALGVCNGPVSVCTGGFPDGAADADVDGGFDGGFDYFLNGRITSITPVSSTPEPVTLLLLGAGFGAVVARRLLK